MAPPWKLTDSDLLINLSTGYLSAFFFILFDLLLNTFLDYSFTWIASANNHRLIRHGAIVTVGSADIPGITGYLIGSRFSFINVTLTAFKVAFYSFILIVELSIDRQTYPNLIAKSNTGRFRFDPSDSEWGGDKHRRAIQRPHGFIWQCSEEDNEAITFYSVSFNLTSDIINSTEADIVSQSGLDDDSVNVIGGSLKCMSPGNVDSKDIQEVLRISGCSPLSEQRCTFGISKPLKVDTDFIDGDFGEFNSDRVGSTASGIDSYPLYHVFKMKNLSFTEQLGYAYHNYSVSSFTCAVPDRTETQLEQIFRVNDDQMSGDRAMRQTFTSSQAERQAKKFNAWSCILIARRGEKLTLVELWDFDRVNKSLSRPFAGPILQGNISIGERIRNRLLYQTFHSFSWLTFSALIVSEAAVFEPVNQTFLIQKNDDNPVTVTKLPLSIVISVMVVTSLITTVYICVYMMNLNDERPKINTVNGLSSVARDVQYPSDNSLRKGPGITLALSQRMEGVAHFGPIDETHQVAFRNMNMEIE